MIDQDTPEVPAPDHTANVSYWLKGKSVQNFGDYLTAIFLSDLFYPEPVRAAAIRLVGSALDSKTLLKDLVLPTPNRNPCIRSASTMFFNKVTSSVGVTSSGKTAPKKPWVFWACGMRKPTGLDDNFRRAISILGVRGPLSRAALKLDPASPIGDPGLLLPYMYEPRRDAKLEGKTICIPHFIDDRTDEELLTISGVDRVLRPNIPNHTDHLYETIDSITTADFVLTASLHGAITAVAYGKPFAYWINGVLDLPFKWDDFSASVNIKSPFASNLAEGRKIYFEEVAPKIQIPTLLPILSIAPFPVRTGPLDRLLKHEWQQAAQTEPGLSFEQFVAAVCQEHPTVEKMLLNTQEAAVTYGDDSGIRWLSGSRPMAVL